MKKDSTNIHINTSLETAEKSKIQIESTFEIKNRSVCGSEMLVLDPRKWSQLEIEHLAAGLNLSSNGHTRESGNP